MNDQLEDGLLVGKGKKQSKQYKRRFDQCEQKLKILKNKNNELQKNMNLQMESDVRHAVKQQGQLLEKDINQLKNLITKLSNDYIDQASKNKIRDLWKMVGTEVERNKRIISQFAVRASTTSNMKRSVLRNNKNKNNGNTKTNTNTNTNSNKRIAKKYDSQYSNTDLIQRQGDIEEQVDAEQILLQERIMAQKAAILKQIQEKNNQINRLYNDMADIVGGQQRDMVNQIDNNLETAEQNMIQANQELDQARIQQKKAKKKYICISVTIIISLLVLAGIIYLFLR